MQESTWTCSVGTLDNILTNPSCEGCDTPVYEVQYIIDILCLACTHASSERLIHLLRKGRGIFVRSLNCLATRMRVPTAVLARGIAIYRVQTESRFARCF